MNEKSPVAAKPLPSNKIFRFASLPPELRNKIYFFALTDDKEILLISRTRLHRRTVALGSDAALKESRRRKHRSRYYSHGNSIGPVTKPSLAPGILLLNRQFFAEAQPILYGANVFALEDTSTLHAFCANIGLKNCATLRELVLKEWGYGGAQKTMNGPAFTILANATNLTRLHIDCFIHSYGDAGHVARHFFREAHHWFVAAVQAKGDVDAALGILHLADDNFDYGHHRWYGRAREQPTKEVRIEAFQNELKKLLKG